MGSGRVVVWTPHGGKMACEESSCPPRGGGASVASPDRAPAALAAAWGPVCSPPACLGVREGDQSPKGHHPALTPPGLGSCKSWPSVTSQWAPSPQLELLPSPILLPGPPSHPTATVPTAHVPCSHLLPLRECQPTRTGLCCSLGNPRAWHELANVRCWFWCHSLK